MHDVSELDRVASAKVMCGHTTSYFYSNCYYSRPTVLARTCAMNLQLRRSGTSGLGQCSSSRFKKPSMILTQLSREIIFTGANFFMNFSCISAANTSNAAE
jgi:hypothetical protein